ncbi:MAG TPA: hypothetical protein PKX06_06325, partial [Phenylobacterium sp.]|nr:hypothetical protein [Phenylobacterium sp.]
MIKVMKVATMAKASRVNMGANLAENLSGWKASLDPPIPAKAGTQIHHVCLGLACPFVWFVWFVVPILRPRGGRAHQIVHEPHEPHEHGTLIG